MIEGSTTVFNLDVSIHAPARGATRADCADRRDDRVVSIHAPARGATAVVRIGSACPAAFQSTRPRGARPYVPRGDRRTIHVSIHAPARGATSAESNGQECPPEFQSTRPRGARLRRTMAALPVKHAFQSTRPRGARPLAGRADATRAPVSIHAPARGATGRCGHSRRWHLVSIHAPARGATWPGRASSPFARCFNPRAREGRDGGLCREVSPVGRFNPRAREGRDAAVGARGHAVWVVSIHAPARGATRPGVGLRRVPRVSIHAPARGATKFRSRNFRTRKVSIHAPARGATRVHGCGVPCPVVSIHAPARGATHRCRPRPTRSPCFNPRAREGRDAVAAD